MKSQKGQASLIMMLIVLAIIVTMAAMAIPAVQAAYQMQNEANAANQLQALASYEQSAIGLNGNGTYSDLPPPVVGEHDAYAYTAVFLANQNPRDTVALWALPRTPARGRLGFCASMSANPANATTSMGLVKQFLMSENPNPNMNYCNSIQQLNEIAVKAGGLNSGPPGMQGPLGPPGVAGPAGTDGSAGAAGTTGPAGPAGATGPPGIQGLQGLQGIAGAIGAVGPQGIQGPLGPAGITNAKTMATAAVNVAMWATTSVTGSGLVLPTGKYVVTGEVAGGVLAGTGPPWPTGYAVCSLVDTQGSLTFGTPLNKAFSTGSTASNVWGGVTVVNTVTVVSTDTVVIQCQPSIAVALGPSTLTAVQITNLL